MAQIAKKFLKQKTYDGAKQVFSINQKKDGGIAGSLVGFKYIEKIGDYEYRITSDGLYWITTNRAK